MDGGQDTVENAYRDIKQKRLILGIDEDRADVKLLAKNAISPESIGKWLLIIDNTDDVEILFGTSRSSNYLPLSPKDSILFTTRYVSSYKAKASNMTRSRRRYKLHRTPCEQLPQLKQHGRQAQLNVSEARTTRGEPG
jgi:hypothetical protein